MHESIQYPNDICYIRSSNCEIDQIFNLLYLPGSSRMRLPSNHKSTLTFIGVLAGLHPKSLVSSRRYIAYFHWESTLCFLCATSIPRKCLGLPMFFVTKWYLRYSFVSTRPAKSFPVSRISSIYTAKITKSYLVCRTKIDYSEWQRWNQYQRWWC